MIDLCQNIYIYIYSIWLLQTRILAFVSWPVFLPNILPTIARVIHNYQWLFSYILHELTIWLLKAFLTFWTFQNLLSRYFQLTLPSKCSRFGETLTSTQISPTKLMTLCKMSPSLVIGFTYILRECLWQCMSTAFGCSARMWVETPDFFPIMFDAPSYVWPLQLLKLRFILMRISLITYTMVSLLIFSNR